MQARRETGTGYLLWFLCLFGLCGIHRFYCGRWVSGLIWLFTGGLFFVGQFIDLFVMSSLVEDANRKRRLGVGA